MDLKGEFANVDWAAVGKAFYFQGIGEGLKLIAAGTVNKIDDAAIGIVDKVAHMAMGVPEEAKEEVK